MANTVRTKSDLLSRLADNTSGDISAQDLRDVVFSVMGNYGGIYSNNSSESMTNVSTSFTKITGFDSTYESSSITCDTDNNKLIFGVTGVYDLSMSISFEASGGRDYAIAFYKEGGSQLGSAIEISVASNTLYEASLPSQYFQILANESVYLAVKASAGSGNTFNPKDLSLTAKAIG